MGDAAAVMVVAVAAAASAAATLHQSDQQQHNPPTFDYGTTTFEMSMTSGSIAASYDNLTTSSSSSSSPSNADSLQFCPVHNRTKPDYDLDVEAVKYVTYGVLMPTICALGIVGNVLNLIVLNQPNMKGTAYIYMRGYSSAALTAIIVAIPFAVRIVMHSEVGEWTNIYQAFFHTYLELYLGNSCLGIGVVMLVALTLERFVAVCHPEKSRVLNGSRRAYMIIASIPVCTLLVYSPHLFRSNLVHCLSRDGLPIFQKQENKAYVTNIFFRIYVWLIAIVFRLGPTILLAYLNLRIIIAYRRTCANRRRMTGKTSRDDNKKFAEESRIMLLLGSTSVLFFVCVTPMVILSLVISDALLRSGSFPFEVFRATANFLEVTNYSLTFYIYCLFSREFRNTFLGLFKPKVRKSSLVPTGGLMKPSARQRESIGEGRVGLEPGAGAGGSSPLLRQQRQSVATVRSIWKYFPSKSSSSSSGAYNI